MGYIALLGCVFFAAVPFTFNTGLQYTNASRGVLLLASMPMWSAWLARRVVDDQACADVVRPIASNASR